MLSVCIISAVRDFTINILKGFDIDLFIVYGEAGVEAREQAETSVLSSYHGDPGVWKPGSLVPRLTEQSQDLH